MIRVTTDNTLHIEADKLFNNWSKYNRKFEEDHAEALKQIIIDNSMVAYVSDRLNDSEAFTGNSKDEIKQLKQNWKRRCGRAVALHYATTDADGTTYNQGLDVVYNRTDRVYHVEIRGLKDNETISNNGDIVAKKEKTKKDEKALSPASESATEVKENVNKDNEKLRTDLNTSAKEIAEKDRKIAELRFMVDELSKENERLKKERAVVVEAINKKGIRVTQLRQMVAV